MSACALLVSFGCVKDPVPSSDTDSESDSSSDAPPSTMSTTETPTTGGTPESTSTTTAADDTQGTTESPADDGPFPVEPDLGDGVACDPFVQDCGPGLKCMPWASDGGNAWTGWACRPMVDDPAGIEEPCMVEAPATSGLDDCELGSMCWDVNLETNEGTCVPFCVGTYDQPSCEDPHRMCAQTGDGVLSILCLPVCDPLQQDCPDGMGCYAAGPQWSCTSDESGDMGVYGDPCELINVCDPGLVCVASGAVPPGEACEGMPGGCCTELCDLSDPLGDMQCAGAAGGQQCLPWYDGGDVAPPGYENVGVCTLP